ncbi:hypothetical protein H8356DRAFT_1363896 [Neocallimastix lanati (nom. inval.)]|nr:hypothetical protein H8356DRAFT_1363896 [Neocallimastix sp. JGI-2020a]
MCDDKNIDVNNKNKIIDNNIKNNQNRNNFKNSNIINLKGTVVNKKVDFDDQEELTKNLKLEKIKFLSSLDAMEPFIINEEENNHGKTENAKFQSDNLEIVNASVDDAKGRLLIDSAEKLLINSLLGTYEQVSICRGRIYEALDDSNIANAIVVRLKVSIGNYTFTADFCEIDHKDVYFDFLLGLKSIADNYLFIHSMLRSLCRFTSVEKFDIIALIVENQAIENNSIKEIYKNKEVPSQEGKNKDIRKKDIKKSENFNKSEKLKISNTKIPKINIDNKIENFKIISNLKILREKARYIEDPKIMENSKNSINSGDIKDNKIYYNQNIYRNKLIQFDAFMDEKHKDLCQLQNQLYQVFNNIILYMNKILENKIDTYINNNNYQVNAINHKDSSSNESANEIEQEQNEINTNDNKEIEKYATKKQNEIKIGELVKVKKNSRYKLDPYFVGPYKVVKKKFNTVQLMDPNTYTCLERPVHLKNIIKFNTTKKCEVKSSSVKKLCCVK